jgi:hypothetical protein
LKVKPDRDKGDYCQTDDAEQELCDGMRPPLIQSCHI